VFGCELVPPERDQQGAWLDDATGLTAAHLRGAHLRLPGHGAGGPTLEIYSYSDTRARAPAMANHTGYGHIAFEVRDVPGALQEVLDNGGGPLGKVSRTVVAGAGVLEVTYARDPEGNIVELQAWRDDDHHGTTPTSSTKAPVGPDPRT
jgi:glyoxylase I family protein